MNIFTWWKKKKLPEPDAGLITEDTTFNGKPIQIRKYYEDTDRQICKGDELILHMNKGTTDYAKRSFDIEKDMQVNTLFTFNFENELGMTHGIIGGFGYTPRHRMEDG